MGRRLSFTVSTMKNVADLQRACFLSTCHLGSYMACINWAIERLESDEEDGDKDIALLAGATDSESALPLARIIVERYIRLNTLESLEEAAKKINLIKDIDFKYQAVIDLKTAYWNYQPRNLFEGAIKASKIISLSFAR